MIYFAQAQYLFLLLLVPVFLVLYGVVRYRRVRNIRKFGDEKLVKDLMPSYSGAKGWTRIILFSLAFLFFSIGLARPQIGAKLKEHKSKGAEVMIALDVSNSMLAKDYSPNRLEQSQTGDIPPGGQAQRRPHRSCTVRRDIICPASYHDRLRVGENVLGKHLHGVGSCPGNCHG